MLYAHVTGGSMPSFLKCVHKDTFSSLNGLYSGTPERWDGKEGEQESKGTC